MANVIDDLMDRKNDEIDTTKDLYLYFEVDGEHYAIDIIFVKEIIQVVSITSVPETPPYVKGIINLRGDIVPVLNVRLRFGKEEKECDDQTCIVVIKTEDLILGLIVDSVSGNGSIPIEDILPAPSAKLSYSNMYVRNIGKSKDGVKLLLDVDKLLFA